jgi:ribosome maturation factor RimP
MSDQTIDRVTALIAPEVTAAGLSLYDLEHAGGVLRVVVDRPGGVDLEAIAAITRAVSRLLDEHDPLPGHYTLEVSSPGLERRLRVPAHFAGAVGETVKLKLRAGVGIDRRQSGVIVSADDDGTVIRVADAADDLATTDLRVAYSDIQQARTVFDWEPAPKPGKASAARAPRPTRPAPEKKAAS